MNTKLCQQMNTTFWHKSNYSVQVSKFEENLFLQGENEFPVSSFGSYCPVPFFNGGPLTLDV